MNMTVTHGGPVRIMALDRPEARNAVDPPTALALFDAFRAFERDSSASVAILTGEGGAFCAGFDLKAAAHGGGTHWIKGLNIPKGWSPTEDPMPGPMGPTRLWLTKPVIAAIEGPAVAGGLELALWCNLRVAAEDAYFGVYCRRWGVPLIDGGTVRLPRIVGQGRANDMILTGRRVDAPEGQTMGLVDRLTPPGGALQGAIKLAKNLATLPQGCLQADHTSAQLSPADLADGLRREWRSVDMVDAEGIHGAERFAAGAGRGGVAEV